MFNSGHNCSIVSLPRPIDHLPLNLVVLQADVQREMLSLPGIRGDGEVEAGGERLHHIPSVQEEIRLVCPTHQTALSLNHIRHCQGPRPPSLLLSQCEVEGGARNILATSNHHLKTAVMTRDELC